MRSAQIRGRLDDERSVDVVLGPVEQEVCRLRSPSADVVSVVVPVFSGIEATEACLDALAAQTCRLPIEVVVVDDACPDPILAKLVMRICARESWAYIRNTVNAGFAASVNQGAAACRGRYVILLNSDAVLPSGAIDRLLDATRQPSVGTVVPFSNDGGFTSFPLMRNTNLIPTSDEALGYDAAARVSNAGLVAEIPSGTAFCMLVIRACWDKVGGLSLRYGRGYFEDVDFCLRAKRLGFRNVLAADIFVRHIGGQSFGSHKRALVADNALLLRERFPDYYMDWASFVAADPIRSLRGAIERRLPPVGPVHLIVGRRSRLGPILSLRAAAVQEAGLTALGLSWGLDGSVVLKAFDGSVPQNLCFEAREPRALRAYLRALDLRMVEIAEPDAMPAPVLSTLIDIRAPVSVLVADRSAARFMRRDRPAWLSDGKVIPLDAMAAAALGSTDQPGPSRVVRKSADVVDPCMPVRIAALSPVVSIEADRLLVALDKRLCGIGGEVIILGEAWGAGRSRPKATGYMAPGDYAAALRHRGITHLLLPDPDGHFYWVEHLRREIWRSAVYFDWSGGTVRTAPGDLPLPDTMDLGSAVMAIMAWCSPQARFEPPAGYRAA
jgi:GT2 family glycosyltransferase